MNLAHRTCLWACVCLAAPLAHAESIQVVQLARQRGIWNYSPIAEQAFSRSLRRAAEQNGFTLSEYAALQSEKGITATTLANVPSGFGGIPDICVPVRMDPSTLPTSRMGIANFARFQPVEDHLLIGPGIRSTFAVSGPPDRRRVRVITTRRATGLVARAVWGETGEELRVSDLNMDRGATGIYLATTARRFEVDIPPPPEEPGGGEPPVVLVPLPVGVWPASALLGVLAYQRLRRRTVG